MGASGGLGSAGINYRQQNLADETIWSASRADGVLRWGQAGDRQMVREGTEILRVLELIDRLRAKA